jgi:MSHA type pilus biogenesis protein MshL
MKGEKPFCLVILSLFPLAFSMGCSATMEPRAQSKPKEPPPILSEPSEPKQPPPAARTSPPPLLPLKPPPTREGLESLVSLQIVEGGLKEVIHALAQQAGVNVIIDPDVEDARVSLNLQRIPLWQALDALLTSHGLYFSSHPGYVRISKMITRVFHLDYVVSVRSGASTTQVSLSSGTSATTAITSTTGVSPTAQTGGTTAAQLSTSASSGDISIQTQETVDFWRQLEARIKELMRDPRYQILRAEYEHQDLRRQMELMPYEAHYDKELIKHQIEMFQLEREVTRKKIETGLLEAQPTAQPAQTVPARTSRETTTGAKGAAEATTAVTGTLLGTYSLDPHTGTLIVTTTPAVMERIEKFLQEVRENLARQVHIDVQILEVTLNDDRQLGVDWNGFPGLLQIFRMPRLKEVVRAQIEDQATTGGGGGGGTSTTGGQGIVSPLPVSPFTASPLGALQMGLLFAPRHDLAIQYTINNVISFLQTQGDVRAVSRPQITTLNNQPAVISVGINDFYVTFEQQTVAAAGGGIATSQVTSRVNPLFIGVTLHITPQISPQGEIVLKVVPAVNQRVGEKLVPTGIPSAPTQSIPLLETRQTSTVVRLKDGQTLLISGLIQEREVDTEKSVPYLSSVPVLGPIFRHSSKEKKRSELILLLTPRIVDLEAPAKGARLNLQEREGRSCTRNFSA